MPVLTRLIPSPVVVDIRAGALDDLGCVLADERISHSGKLAVAVSGGSGARLRERVAPSLPGADWFEVGGGTLDDAIKLAGAMKGGHYDAVVGLGGAREPGHPRRPQRRHRMAFGPGGSDVDILLFLDDDGLLARTDTAELCREAFAADDDLGIISFRIADPDTGETQRRHVPRLRASDPMRSSRVTTFLGGANAVRTRVLTQVGGLPDAFFYAHEETDLAWRALDAGWMIDYRSDMVLNHPDDRALPARRLPPHGRPQPRLVLGRCATAPRAAGPGLPSRIFA
ncbi:hypothetical protein STENM327S_03426 [Streptomyces tendae]